MHFRPCDVKALQLVRCKSLFINGVPQELADDVCKVVTGKSEILDLSQAKKNLKPLRKFLIFISSPSARALAKVQFAELDDAINDFNIAKFEETRSVILALCDSEMAAVKERSFENDTWKH